MTFRTGDIEIVLDLSSNVNIVSPGACGQMSQSGQFNLGQTHSTRLLDLAEEIVEGYEIITRDIEVI